MGTHLLSDIGKEEPNFLLEIPVLLHKEKVISKVISADLCHSLKAIIGLRNIIAHEYGDLDFKIIFKIMKENLNDINAYLNCIMNYCQL
jgi:uncharacterized protein YutE (UPF0331/DUF86 family)